MSVWMLCPSARPVEEAETCFARWRALGYKLAVFRELVRGPVTADLLVKTLPYPGYALAQNTLCALVLAEDSTAEWLVCAADDVHPDPTYEPEEIALQCVHHFLGDTFGVMQPTGDRWGECPASECHDFIPRPPGSPMPDRCTLCGRTEDDAFHQGGAYIDRVAGSPWIGREFARRMYGGKGPYWPGYTHMGVDEELRAVALLHGVYWPRRDLMHFHAHWGRPRAGERIGRADRMPEFLRTANSGEEWNRYKRLFAERKAAGFPGSEPL